MLSCALQAHLLHLAFKLLRRLFQLLALLLSCPSCRLGILGGCLLGSKLLFACLKVTLHAAKSSGLQQPERHRVTLQTSRASLL